MPRTHERLTAKSLPAAFEELVRLHPPRVIHDEAGYGNTQEIVDALTGIPRLSKGQSEYLETLGVLMEAYEQEHHAIDVSKLSALEMLKFLMEQHSWQRQPSRSNTRFRWRMQSSGFSLSRG